MESDSLSSSSEQIKLLNLGLQDIIQLGLSHPFGPFINYNDIRVKGEPIGQNPCKEVAVHKSCFSNYRDLTFPPYEIKKERDKMNIRCILLGHKWINHKTFEGYESLFQCITSGMALVFSLLSVGLLLPIFSRLNAFFPEYRHDATCSRCQKCKFDATDAERKKVDENGLADRLAARHKKLSALRDKAA